MVMVLDIDLDTLRLLVAISETGSLTKAAAVRGITQPAASARVRSFEVRWRLAVVSRSSSGSRLTTDGDAVVSWARSVLYEADTMRTSLAALSTERRAEMTVAASLTVAEHVLPRWLGELHARHPGVSPTLRVVNSEQVLVAVRSGDADLGFIETVRLPEVLAHTVVGEDRLIVVVAPDHAWAGRPTALSHADLVGARWVLREPGSGTRSTFEAALGEEVIVALEGSSTTALIGAAVAGVGPAVVSVRSVTAELETGRLVEVGTNLDLMRPLTAVWRQDQRLSDPASDLLAIAAPNRRDGSPRRLDGRAGGP